MSLFQPVLDKLAKLIVQNNTLKGIDSVSLKGEVQFMQENADYSASLAERSGFRSGLDEALGARELITLANTDDTFAPLDYEEVGEYKRLSYIEDFGKGLWKSLIRSIENVFSFTVETNFGWVSLLLELYLIPKLLTVLCSKLLWYTIVPSDTFWFLAALNFLLILFSILTCINGGEDERLEFFAGIPIFLLMPLWLPFAFLFCFLFVEEKKDKATWKRTKLKKFPSDIPLTSKIIANMFLYKAPKATLYIEELVEGKDEKPTGEAFLLAEQGGAELYLEHIRF